MKSVINFFSYISCIVMYMLILPAFAADQQMQEELKELMQTYTNDKYYDCVCWLTSHNSYAHRQGGDAIKKSYYINPNQILNIKGQLEFGVRGFMIDLYYELDKNNDKTGQINIAHAPNEHSSFRFYEQSFILFLTTIKDWLDSNPEDIITLHLESYIKDNALIIKNVEEAGLKKYLFDLLDNNDNWPTLGWMRENNKRLIIFSDKREDEGNGIIGVSSTMETEYDIGKFSNCEKRLDGRQRKSPIFTFNHFYKYSVVPVFTTMAEVFRKLEYIVDTNTDLTLVNQNQYKNLVQRIALCFFQEGQWPNFMAVDNVSSLGGGERKIVIDINKNNNCCIGGYKYYNGKNDGNGMTCNEAGICYQEKKN